MITRLWVHGPGSWWSADWPTQEELQQGRRAACSACVTSDVVCYVGRSHQSYQPSCKCHWAWLACQLLIMHTVVVSTRKSANDVAC